MDIISTPDAPPPGGHYAQAVRAKGLVFVSGLLPVSRTEPTIHRLPFAQQADLVLAHADAVLRAAGLDRTAIVKATVYITDIALWGDFNRAYAAFLGDHTPARAVVPVPQLHHGFDVELELIAETPD